MRDIDREDAIFVAAALLVPECKIWSNDKHLQAQNKIETITTENLLK